MSKRLMVRKWLNRKGYNTTANVYLDMDFYSNKRCEEEELADYCLSAIQGEIEISDCSKKIRLTLYSDNQAEARNNLFKINTLIETLAKARTYIEEHMQELKAK